MILVEAKAKLNLENKKNYTPLDLVDIKEHGDLRDYLVKEGALQNTYKIIRNAITY
jgi:hypothetical protein